jgi:hypothetical protein
MRRLSSPIDQEHCDQILNDEEVNFVKPVENIDGALVSSIPSLKLVRQPTEKNINTFETLDTQLQFASTKNAKNYKN